MPDPTCQDLCSDRAIAAANKAVNDAYAIAYGAFAMAYLALSIQNQTTITNLDMQISMFPGGCTC